MTVLGADPVELDRLADSIGRTVDRIERSERDIGNYLDTPMWHGRDADRLRHDWRARGRPSLEQVRSILAGCATNLRAQAAAQRLASGELSAADAAYLAVARNTTSRSYDFGLHIPVRFVNINGDFNGTGTVTQDGYGYLATISGRAAPGASASVEGKGGKGGKGREVKAEAGSYVEAKETRTYRFATRQEADAFLKGFRDVSVPNGHELAQNSLPLALSPAIGAANLTADARRDGDAYLRKFKENKVSHTIETSDNAFSKVDFGVGKVKFSQENTVGAGIEHNIDTGDNTAFVTGKTDVGAALGIGSGSMEGEIRTGLTLDRNGNPTEMSLSGSVDLQGKLENMPGLNMPSLSAQGTVTFDAHLDLLDPANRREAYAYLQAVSTGDPVASAQHLTNLLRGTAVTLTTQDAVTTGHSFDAGGIVTGGVERTRANTQDVLIRVPGGDWTHYPINND